jgi:hypothetical protein
MRSLEERIVQQDNLEKPQFLTPTPCGCVNFMRASMDSVPGQIGLTGGKFFTLSYSFLGQVSIIHKHGTHGL